MALTQALVRIPTVNPPGDAYGPCAELVGERLRRRGFEVGYLRAEGTPGDTARNPRINVVARWESGLPGPCVHFNGHIDVVPAGQGWTMDPWRGDVRDGRVYGRGTCDMKGGLAAAIVAVETLIESGIRLPGALEISGTVDEESGGYGGVAWLAGKGFFSRPRVDHVIIPEPLNVDRVCIGHRGVWWAEIETMGRIAHGSMPFLGDCAVRHMGAVIDAFERELWPALAARRTEMPVVPDGARASTMNLNSIHGGQTEDHEGLPSPCVPDSCRLVIDRRFLIEERLEDVKGEVHGLLGAARRRAGRVPLSGARRHGGSPRADRAHHAGAARGGRRGALRAGSRGAVHLLARHLRPEAHRPHRPPARLRRLRPGHPRPRPPARRVRRHRRPGRLGQGDGTGDAGAAGRRAMIRPGRRNGLGDVAGLVVGNAEDHGARTGVTVVLADRPALAAVDVRGGAPGTINTDLLRPGGLISKVDGIVLSGGSVFGLEAATGLTAWLAERGRGFTDWGPCLPIVSGAILFDLVNGGDKEWGGRPPYRDLAQRAADAAGRETALGNVGAGLGSVAGAIKGGLGAASAVDATTGITVAALVAVNSVGSVTMPGSRTMWAWHLEQAGELGGQAAPRDALATPSRPSAASA